MFRLHYGTGGGGACEVLSLRKAGAEKVLAMLLGGGTKCFGVVFMQLLEVVAILKGMCSHIEGGGAHNVSSLCYFYQT